MQRLFRTEDARLITGQGRFVHNLALPGMRFGVFVRSSVASALIDVDLWAAKQMPGVVQIVSAADLGALRLPKPNPLLPELTAHVSPFLAGDEVRYVGEPIVLVVASDVALAQQAADAVQVRYSPKADEPESPHFEVRHHSGTPQKADLTVSITHRQPRVQAMSMEPRASVARWNADDQSLTFWTGTQAVARARDMLAEVLTIDVAKVRVIAPDVGGAFGAKASLYPEDFVLAFAARALQASVQWTSTRSEEFLSATQGRGAAFSGALSINASGEFVGLEADFDFPLGAWLPFSAAVPLRNAVRILPGPYRVPHVKITGAAKFTHEAATNIYRGAGRPEAALLMERLIDDAARQARIDPVALRQKNLIRRDEMPFKTPTGETLDAGDYPLALSAACEAFGYAAARVDQATRRGAGGLVGIGVACYVEPCGQGWESARVTLLDNGQVEVASGSSAQGQGHETSFALIAAEVLGIDASRITVVHGDTAFAPDGIGALASRSMAIGGSAIREAALHVKAALAAGASYPIIANVKYTARMEAWSYGAVIAALSIDADTGVATIERIVWADDAGRIISPMLAKGQLLGGLAQGLGQAMMEAIRYDATGQLETGSLMDYAIPRATDMPPVEIISIHEPTNANTLGAKGVGEAGCIGVPAAILNAACDALTDFETSTLTFPLTSETLWRVLQTPKVTPP